MPRAAGFAADAHVTPPAVSVLLPAYNAAATIDVAVRSILGQTFQDIELIVIDDGSRDGTAQRVEALQDGRIRIFSEGRNAGLAVRLNQGIDLARGRYIARMDADDVAYPERLERQFRFMETNLGVDLLGARALVFEGEGEIVGLLPFHETHEQLCRRLWNGIYLPHPTWFGRAAWFRRFRYGIPEVVRAEDQDLLLRACGESCYACLPEVLLGYRQGAYSLRRTLKARQQMFRSQWRNHLRASRWGDAIMSVLVLAAKSGMDVFALLPLVGGLHPRNARQIPSPDVAARWRQVWAAACQCEP